MHIVRHRSLLGNNTLALQANAAAFVRVSSIEELRQALVWASRHGKAVLPLGEGSNIVLAGDVDALVIELVSRGIDVVGGTDEEIFVEIAGGENWHSLVEWSVAQGYSGLENLALIPGTVGAAPVQNIGAYGVELASVLRSVRGIQIDTGEAVQFSVAECNFAYRDSVFKRALRDKVVITSVELALSRRPRSRLEYPALGQYFECRGVQEPTPREVLDAVVAIRRSKLPNPRQLPNVGSFFKNPVVSDTLLASLREREPDMPAYPIGNGWHKVPAAWLIEQCHWKGRREGNIGVHPEHALVLVNYGCKDGRKLLGFAQRVAASVAHKFGIDLETEPRVYGLG